MNLAAQAEHETTAMNLPVLQQLWSAMNTTDRLFASWYLLLGLVLLFLRSGVEHLPDLLLLHAGVVGFVCLLVWHQSRSRLWRVLHDWYPVLLFTAGFEETARLSFLFRSGWQDYWILAIEKQMFPVPPTVWLGQHSSPWITELLAVGYFSFYGFFVTVAGVLYVRAHRKTEPLDRSIEARHAFRDLTDSIVLGYIVCFVIYLLFPTEGPRHTLAQTHAATPLQGGPFHWAVGLIQSYGGVHGNAFPSSHVMAATVALIFAWRYARQLSPWLTALLLLMCVGAVNDRYHYVSDVIAGLVIGGFVTLPSVTQRRAQEGRESHRSGVVA